HRVSEVAGPLEAVAVVRRSADDGRRRLGGIRMDARDGLRRIGVVRGQAVDVGARVGVDEVGVDELSVAVDRRSRDERRRPAVFAGEGFDRATMEMIAARSGVTKPTLYTRFGSKESLFAAAVEREYELRKARLFAAYDLDGDLTFRERLHAWVAAYFDFVYER